jgi:hypothetical protein
MANVPLPHKNQTVPMKLKSLLFVTAIAAGLQANAQTWVADSVEMGAGYANDIFYSLQTGADSAKAANTWDLAFQMTKFGDPMFNASVRANHIKKAVKVYSLHMAVNATSFAAISASDTVGKTMQHMQLMNVDTSWGEGAFYQNRDQTDLFDYGWGKYQGSPNHNLLGDSVYLVKVGSGASAAVYKLWIQEYVSMVDSLIGYKFRVASWDNSLDNSVYVKRKDYQNRSMVYYDIATNTFIDREPNKNNWDILFTQYAKIAPGGGPMMGGPNPIAFTGVLSNVRVKIAKVKTSDPDSKVYSNYTYYNETNLIGDDWKAPVGSPPTGYSLDTVTYFVKSHNAQQYYQIKFTGFTGTIGGAPAKITFAQKYVAPTAVTNYAIVPNPAVNDASLMVDVKDAAKGARLLVTDITGRVMMNNPVELVKGLNGFRINTSGYAAGTYIVTLSDGSWKITDKMVVQH